MGSLGAMRSIAVIIVACIFSFAEAFNFKNNVCKTYLSYFFRFSSKNCYYNDELFLETPEILSLRNIPYENHTVTTKDGYILGMARVLQGNPKGIIVFIHPLTLENNVWLIGKNRSAVANFRKAGYEIWLPNWRGQPFSRGHVNKNITSKEYWSFSLTEIGLYDFSALFNYIYNVTNSKIIVFGHSMGSTASLIYASLLPDEAEKLVTIFITVSTPAFPRYSPTHVRLLAPFIPVIKMVSKKINLAAIGDNQKLNKYVKVARKIILMFPLELLISFIGTIPFGGSAFVANPEDVPVMFSYAGEPVCLNIFYHLFQLLTSNIDDFVMYDYGEKENLKKYGSKVPPRYPLENITVPFYLVHGGKDSVADKRGNMRLYEELPDKVKKYGMLEIPEYNHDDFFVAKDRVERIYNTVLNLLKQI